MRPLFKRLTSIGVGLTLAALATAAAPAPDAKAKVGEKAPAFELVDLDGKAHKLEDFKGKTLVLEWFNPGCPWCRKVYDDGVVKDTLAAMKKLGKDYVYVAVNSTANMAEDRVKTQSAEFLASHEIKIPVLMDYSGAVGKAYGARTTPHMYVIDGEGVLRYQGAFADRKDMKGMNYVIGALEQIASGATVAPDATEPWGCSVKYKK